MAQAGGVARAGWSTDLEFGYCALATQAAAAHQAPASSLQRSGPAPRCHRAQGTSAPSRDGFQLCSQRLRNQRIMGGWPRASKKQNPRIILQGP